MGKINKEWHLANKMPEKATFKQRMQWHLEHEKHCQCYPISDKIKQELEEYKKSI